MEKWIFPCYILKQNEKFPRNHSIIGIGVCWDIFLLIKRRIKWKFFILKHVLLLHENIEQQQQLLQFSLHFSLLF